MKNPDKWIPNIQGGRENLEAINLLKTINASVSARHPGACMIAEESTSWPLVSKPTDAGGLGFHFKWNMGWMNDTLDFISKDPIHRRYHLENLTFGLLYAFTENFVLPLSHDEVVHGKKSLLGRMPGEDRQPFANLRMLLAMMYGHPGKKLLFMGGEFGQWIEWNSEQSLDWHLVEHGPHAGIQKLVRDLNTLYVSEPALHEMDSEWDGFQWIDFSDKENQVVSWIRRSHNEDDFQIFIFNLTPMDRSGYRIGVPVSGSYDEIAQHGQPCSLELTLPPLSALILKPARSQFN